MCALVLLEEYSIHCESFSTVLVMPRHTLAQKYLSVDIGIEFELLCCQTDLIVALEADVLQAGKENQPVLHHIIGLQEEDESKGLAVHGGNFLGKSY